MIESIALGSMAKLATKEGSSATKFLPAGAAGVAILGGGLKCFTTVPAGHIGMRVRWEDYQKRNGALRSVVRPGRLKFALPWSDSIHSLSVQDSNMNLPNFCVTDSKGRQFDVGAQITWGIAPERGSDGRLVTYHLPYAQIVHRAMVRSVNPEERAESISGICSEGLRSIMCDEPDVQDLSGKVLFPILQGRVNGELLDKYGAEIRRLTIPQVAETNASLMSDSIRGLGSISVRQA